MIRLSRVDELKTEHGFFFSLDNHLHRGRASSILGILLKMSPGLIAGAT